ncbi:MAG: response regulator transcription factor [Ignavibacteriae bacterium]|nr:response regulator transcription factor [Ignavibacteria bacterium]MBI3363584.1 response regulator transcription factor [Ignavibacteriota bacterium]
MIRILIADDHPLIREGFKRILKEHSDLSVVKEAQTGQEALEYVVKEKLDIVLLDIGLPDRNGIDVLKEMKKRRPKLPVLVLSMYPENRFAVRAIRAGAAGYITKESAAEELVKAIRKIVGGGRYISSTLADKLAGDLQTESTRAPHEILSDREYEILCLIASGKTVSEIGEKLHLSVKTVSTYRSRILEKMKMKTNAELTHYTITNRLVD